MHKKIVFLDTHRENFPTNSRIVKMLYNVFIQQYINLKYKFNIIRIIKKIKDKKLFVYSFDDETSRKLHDESIENITIKKDLSKTFYDRIDKDCVEFIKHFYSKNELLKSTLDYQDINLWDLVQFDTWNYMKKKIILLESIKDVIVKEKPQQIHIFDTYSDISKIVQILSKSYDFNIVNHELFLSYIFKNIKNRIAPLFFSITKPWGIGKIYLKNRESSKIRPHIATKKKKYMMFGNYLFPPQLFIPWSNKLKKLGEYDLIFVSYTNTRNLVNRMPGVKFVKINSYSNKQIVEKVSAKSKQLKNLFRNIKNNHLSSSIKYKDFSIYSLMEDLLSYYFNYYLIELVKYIELSKNAFEIEKPDLNISYDEISKATKAVNYSANITGVPTILIQHGMVGGYPLYGRFFTDIFAVYGENSKKVYLNWGVDEKKIKVIGNIKFDSLYENLKKYNRESTLDKLKINKSRKVILFTSHLMEKEEREVLFSALFDALSKLGKDYYLIIKLHPSEDGRFQIKMAKKSDNCLVIKDIDIFEVINACDLLITFYSTTGLEAMALNKPVIIINLTGMPDRVPYVRENAALGVYKKQNLLNSILKCFDDHNFREKLIASQNKFIYNEAYKIDGKVTNRLLDLISELIHKK